MIYSITALEKDPLTNVIGYVIRANVPEAMWPRMANPDATPAWSRMHATDLADLKAGKIVERPGAYDMSSGTVEQAAAHLIGLQQAFQAEVTAGSLEPRYAFNGFQWTGTVWE
jgi:hypothetical protein